MKYEFPGKVTLNDYAELFLSISTVKNELSNDRWVVMCE